MIPAEPSKETPSTVAAVVNFVAERTFLSASAVLSTFPNPTSDFVTL